MTSSDLPRNQTVQKPVATRKFSTFRISNIPREVTENRFRDILTSLPIIPRDIADQTALLGFSYSPHAVPSLAGRYSVATVTFKDAPAPGLLETAIKGEVGVAADRLKVDVDFLGITPLADSLQDSTVDIIAVTGLAGHAFGSWKSKDKPDMWLRDFLPQSILNARILTYGYDTKLPGSQSETSILELSRRLLESIKTIRHEKSERPLILIGHDLGGLVVKEALVQASEGSEDDQIIFRSCYAVLLFGVPNRGLDNSSLMSMVKGQPSENLVKDLGESSRFLRLLHQRFNKCFTLHGSKIICVFETRRTPTVEWCLKTGSWERTGPKVMMVPHTSAIDAGPTEKTYDQLSIDADHFGITKFSDISDPDYLIIESRIQGLVANAQGAIRDRFSQHRRKTSPLETHYIETLTVHDYAAFRNYEVDNPTQGTLGLFLNNPILRSWLLNNEASVLLVQGSQGQGKTILAKFALAYLKGESASSPNSRTTVIHFFFDDQDDNHRTVGAALRSLIKQLLSIPGAFQTISQRFDIEASTLTDDSLSVILEELLRSPNLGTIYCVIDALDECQDNESRQRLIDFIKRLVQSPTARGNHVIPALKVFLTSRPAVDLNRNLNTFPIHLPASQS
ncbi:Protein SERAC1-like protein [Cladobotryum mycophilum]|uniref:Protein SERAC1-like protein n=1 Tax=Cladobotryum mycophilum TaxID=491253 RepID=A0ABR0SBX9_9HYPO